MSTVKIKIYTICKTSLACLFIFLTNTFNYSQEECVYSERETLISFDKQVAVLYSL